MVESNRHSSTIVLEENQEEPRISQSINQEEVPEKITKEIVPEKKAQKDNLNIVKKKSIAQQTKSMIFIRNYFVNIIS